MYIPILIIVHINIVNIDNIIISIQNKYSKYIHSRSYPDHLMKQHYRKGKVIVESEEFEVNDPNIPTRVESPSNSYGFQLVSKHTPRNSTDMGFDSLLLPSRMRCSSFSTFGGKNQQLLEDEIYIDLLHLFSASGLKPKVCFKQNGKKKNL